MEKCDKPAKRLQEKSGMKRRYFEGWGKQSKLILSGKIFGQYRKFTKQNKTEINLENSKPLSDETNVANKEAAIRQR